MWYSLWVHVQTVWTLSFMIRFFSVVLWPFSSPPQALITVSSLCIAVIRSTRKCNKEQHTYCEITAQGGVQWWKADRTQVCVWRVKCKCDGCWYLLLMAYRQTLKPSSHHCQTLLEGSHQIGLLGKVERLLEEIYLSVINLSQISDLLKSIRNCRHF